MFSFLFDNQYYDTELIPRILKAYYSNIAFEVIKIWFGKEISNEPF